MTFDSLDFENFQWDSGNDRKSLDRHGITCKEGEEIFFNNQLYVIYDKKHSRTEPRYKAFGMTNQRKALTVSFTVREKFIRIISARLMNRRERKAYEI